MTRCSEEFQFQKPLVQASRATCARSSASVQSLVFAQAVGVTSRCSHCPSGSVIPGSCLPPSWTGNSTRAPCPGLRLGRWVRGKGQSEGEANRSRSFSFKNRCMYLFSNIGGGIIVITVWIKTSEDIPQSGFFFLGKVKESPMWLFRRRESMWGPC